MIGIVDYGAGNLRSVRKAFDYLSLPNRIVTGPDQMGGVERLVLPGVGAFAAAMEQLADRDLVGPVREWLAADRPFLGICLGMQVLFESSAESPGVSGFGVLRGTVPRFEHPRVPQIGWNALREEGESPLLEGLNGDTFFYFLHSYYCLPADPAVVAGTAEYGIRYAAMVRRGNCHAVQFHPEKSAEAGLALLGNWASLSV